MSTTDLTDAELLAAPLNLLSKQERQRRRKIRSKQAAQRRRKLRAKRMEEGRAKVIYCQSKTKKGDPCQGYALTGAKHCGQHLNEAEKAKLGRGTMNEEKAKRRLEQPEVNGVALNGPQTMRQVFEVAVEKIVCRYFQAVGFEFQGWDDNGLPIVIDLGAEKGLCLHGESKDGYINMTKYPDLVAQIAVLEKLNDRVYGKPKQTQVLEGGVKPIQVQPVRSVERAKRVGHLLKSVGAIPHEGRRRSEPVEPATDNVVNLNDTEE